MTVEAVIAESSRYKTAVIWSRRMDRAPRIRMTRRTVATTCEVLQIRVVRRCQTTVGCMTVRTGIMRLKSCAGKRIIMTARTVASCLNQ